MKLQRPIISSLHFSGHRWPFRLRLEPGRRPRAVFQCGAPVNDNAWYSDIRLLSMRLWFAELPFREPKQA